MSCLPTSEEGSTPRPWGRTSRVSARVRWGPGAASGWDWEREGRGPNEGVFLSAMGEVLGEVDGLEARSEDSLLAGS